VNCACCPSPRLAKVWSIATVVVPRMSMLSNTTLYGDPKPDDTANPTCAWDAMAMLAELTNCQAMPSLETYPVNVLPCRASRTQVTPAAPNWTAVVPLVVARDCISPTMPANIEIIA